VGSQNVLKYTPEYDLKYASNSTQSYIPSLLDSLLPGKLSRSIQVYSKYVPRLPPRTFSSTLLNMLSTTLPIAHDYILAAIYALM